jgi:hypothetical protein
VGEPTYHCLRPTKVHESDKRLLCRGIGRFLRTYGAWPGKDVLARFLKADRGAVVYLLHELQDSGHIEQYPARRQSFQFFALTYRGWDMAGMKPLQPSKPQPAVFGPHKKINRKAERLVKTLDAQAVFTVE